MRDLLLGFLTFEMVLVCPSCDERAVATPFPSQAQDAVEDDYLAPFFSPSITLQVLLRVSIGKPLSRNDEGIRERSFVRVQCGAPFEYWNPNLRARARMAEARDRYNNSIPPMSAANNNNAGTKRAKFIVLII
jgi:hypothetical protein